MKPLPCACVTHCITPFIVSVWEARQPHGYLTESSGTQGSSPGWGHCDVFLGKTLYSYSAPPHPDELMDTGEFNDGGNHAME